MKKRTIHNIPVLLYPFYLIATYFAATILFFQLKYFGWICAITYTGKEHLKHNPGHILCVWHEDLTLFFCSHPRFDHPNIWMSYPAWYMKPIHILKHWMGIKKIAYGASGIDGKKALEEVMEKLREGWSTFIAPDGPYGPLKEIKDGVLQMSLQTKVPVIPVFFDITKEGRANSWDKKRYPKWFSKMNVVYGTPIQVTKENYENSRSKIAAQMNKNQYLENLTKKSK